MKYFPFKTTVICLLAAPVLYLITLSSFQTYLNRYYYDNVQNILIGDTSKLLDGRVSIEEQLAGNLERFFKTDKVIEWTGLVPKVIVTTNEGKVIYPAYITEDGIIHGISENEDIRKTAKRNFEILNAGLFISIDTNLDHGSKAANVILFFYFTIAILIFLVLYSSSSARADRDRQEKKALIDDLQQEEQAHRKILDELKLERQELFEKIQVLNTKYQEDKNKAKINEEEMFEEIIKLEEELNAFIEFKELKEDEISDLKSEIKKYERRKTSRHKRNEFDFILKRFGALYKNVELNRRAVSGFLNLAEDQQIKAEETILLLDQNPDLVTIKRKVFTGKKNKSTSLEVLFAYNGRLYFRKNENNKIEILVIGTKNTQIKDMEFLHSL